MDEYIKREALLANKQIVGICDAQENFYGAAEVVFADDIAAIPAADVEEVKHGEWVEDSMIGEGVYRCTSCDDKFVTLEGTPYDNRLFYCPFCGAKMDGKNGKD